MLFIGLEKQTHCLCGTVTLVLEVIFLMIALCCCRPKNRTCSRNQKKRVIYDLLKELACAEPDLSNRVIYDILKELACAESDLSNRVIYDLLKELACAEPDLSNRVIYDLLKELVLCRTKFVQ